MMDSAAIEYTLDFVLNTIAFIPMGFGYIIWSWFSGLGPDNVRGMPPPPKEIYRLIWIIIGIWPLMATIIQIWSFLHPDYSFLKYHLMVIGLVYYVCTFWLAFGLTKCTNPKIVTGMFAWIYIIHLFSAKAIFTGFLFVCTEWGITIIREESYYPTFILISTFVLTFLAVFIYWRWGLMKFYGKW